MFRCGLESIGNVVRHMCSNIVNIRRREGRGVRLNPMAMRLIFMK